MAWTLAMDCARPKALAEFWILALGYEEEAPPRGFATWEAWYRHNDIPEDEWDEGASISDPTGAGARIFFQQVPEGKVAKNRLHLDIHAGGDRSDPHEERWARILAAADRLTAAGATLVHEDVWQGRPHHLVMADPEGNGFCLC